MDHYITDGVKSIPLSQLPDEAWTFITGGTADETAVAKLFEAVPWLYRAVVVRANAVASVPWMIETVNDVPVWASTDESVPDAMMWLEDLEDLLFRTEGALTLVGSAYWGIESNAAGAQRVLSWFAPQTMTPKWDEFEGLVAFERRIGTRTMTLSVDDILYFALPNPLHETKAMSSPAASAVQAAGVLDNVDRFASTFFDRGAIKATLLTVQGNPPLAERERLKSWWRRMFSGSDNAFNEGVVNADAVKPVIVGEGLDGLTDQQLTRDKREDISTALGIPHSLLFSNAANFATSQQDKRNFYEDTIARELRLISRAINRQLLNPLGLRMSFDLESMPIFQEDEEQRASSLLQLTQAGVPLPVALEILGFQLPEGVEFLDLEQREPAQPIARAEESMRFVRWLHNRDNPDPADFTSDILSDADKRLLMEDGKAAKDNPFLVAYPTLSKSMMSLQAMSNGSKS